MEDDPIFQRTPSRTTSLVKEAPARETSRPAPPALHAIVDTGRESAYLNRGHPSHPQSPSRTQSRPDPEQEQERESVQATLPSRLSPVRIQSFITTPEPQTTQRTRHGRWWQFHINSFFSLKVFCKKSKKRFLVRFFSWKCLTMF
jgi:hypothetical protein